MTYKTHYLIHGKARCGQPMRRNWSCIMEQVTCLSCQRLMTKELK